MALTLFAHPFAAYCWKVLIALYETETPFNLHIVQSPADWAELAKIWPIKKFPVLVDGNAPFMESSIIIEHLDHSHSGATKLIPQSPVEALSVRFMDRVFDNYVMTPTQQLVSDRMRSEDEHDPLSVAQAKATLDTAYGWLETRLATGKWAAGDNFTLADCAAAPSLFYADWVHPIGEHFPVVSAYRAQLLAHPSVARTVEEARPYRHFFPLGAPDRD